MEKIIEKIKSLIEPILKESEVELYSLTYDTKSKDHLLSILIDKEGGVDLDKCIEISNKVSAILDKEDPIKEEYLLEVASAGVEKPLLNLEHYNKALNEFILVQVKERVEDYDELVGYLRKVNDDSITLEIKIKTRIKKVEIKLDNISLAMTTVNI